MSGSIIKNYDERSAKVLRQPAVVNFIHTKMGEIGTDSVSYTHLTLPTKRIV